MSAASEAAPITSAPRKGALQETTEVTAGAVVASDRAGTAGAAVVTLTLFSATTGGGAVTATERLPFPFSLPGMYSSSTAWKFVPPKPNALTPTRRTLSAGTVHGFSSVLT